MTIAYLDLEPHDNGEIVLIINVRERFSCYTICVISQQVATVLKNKPCDHEISRHDPQLKIRTGVVHKTTQQEDEALQKYLDNSLPTGKLHNLCLATGLQILYAYL